METEKKERKPQRTRREFTDDFKAGAVRLVLQEGKSVTRVAKDLDLVQSVLGRWVEQARADGGKSKRGSLTTDEKEELARLRKENRVLRVEREILKKAAAHSTGRCITMRARGEVWPKPMQPGNGDSQLRSAQSFGGGGSRASP